MKKLVLLLIISLFFSCSVQEESKDFSPQLIAHAGGAIDSCIYTNSREAMLRALEKNGFSRRGIIYLASKDERIAFEKI